MIICTLAELTKIADSLTKKSGVKREDKVYERIGRAKQKYPSIHRYYNIEVEVNKDEVEGETKPAEKKPKKEQKPVVTSLKWTVKEDVDINSRSGVYFLLTSLSGKSEELIWQFYNTIREIEATFRVLKTDLALRPVYHKKDESTMNTQKAVTTLAQNRQDQVINIRRCSEPTSGAKKIYDTLKFKYAPFARKKFVVHKSELNDAQFIDSQSSVP
jgi:hypothetical protein